MNKVRIFFTDFNKLKLVNLSAHANEKVHFRWLWLTLKVTFSLNLTEISSNTVLGEEVVRRAQ